MSQRFENTFELKIKPHAYTTAYWQEPLKAWLSVRGEDSFVEETADSLDLVEIDRETDCLQNIEDERRDDSIVLYKYDESELVRLAKELQQWSSEYVTTLRSLTTKSWLEGWKDSFKPISTRRFWIYPPWEKVVNPPEKIAIEIEPAAAFGTGQHATTALCLDAIADVELEIDSEKRAFARLLDLGTGSGILAVAAWHVGFRNIEAVDIDSDAILATSENALRNGIHPTETLGFVAFQGSLQHCTGQYDVILANILAVVLLPMLAALHDKLLPGGHLILSGILVEQENEIVVAALAYGLNWNLQTRGEQDGWVALTFVKNL